METQFELLRDDPFSISYYGADLECVRMFIQAASDSMELALTKLEDPENAVFFNPSLRVLEEATGKLLDLEKRTKRALDKASRSNRKKHKPHLSDRKFTKAIGINIDPAATDATP